MPMAKMETTENSLGSCMAMEYILLLFFAKCDSMVEGLDWDLIDLHAACPLK
jgi:hypothetical protein